MRDPCERESVPTLAAQRPAAAPQGELMRSLATYSIIVAASALAVINPIVIFLMTGMRSFTAYSFFVDFWLILIIGCGWLFLRSRRRLFGAALSILIILMTPAMLAGEILYVYVRHTYAGQFLGDSIDIYRKDPELVYALKPGASDRHVSLGNFEARYVIDDRGRKKIQPSGDGLPSMHVFGDSFTFGYGVDNQDTWLNIVQSQIGDQYQIYNYGVAGYSLEQMYLSMRRHAAEIQEGDVVIFAPVSTDLERSLVGKTYVCGGVIRDQQAEIFPKLRNGEWVWLELEDECNYYFDTLLANSIFPISFGSLYQAWRKAAHHQAMIDNADRIFAEAERLAVLRGASFHLLFLATPDECAQGAFSFDISDLASPYRSFLPYCPDSAPASLELRFPHDGHWNERGNRWAAEAFLEVLDQLPAPTADRGDGEAARAATPGGA